MSEPSDAERAREIVTVAKHLEDHPDAPWTVAIFGALYGGSWGEREGAEDFAAMIRARAAAALSAARAEGRAEGRAEEREACARVVDALAERYKREGCLGYTAILRVAAAAIRGRKP